MEGFGTDSLLGKAKKEDVPCRFFVGRGMVMVTCSGSVLSPSSMFGNFMNLLI